MNILSIKQEFLLIDGGKFFQAIVEDQVVKQTYQLIHGQRRMTTTKEHNMVCEAIKKHFKPINQTNEEQWNQTQKALKPMSQEPN